MEIVSQKSHYERSTTFHVLGFVKFGSMGLCVNKRNKKRVSVRSISKPTQKEAVEKKVVITKI